MSRVTVTSGSPMEPVIGFSRAVRIGEIVAVAGTAPIAADGGGACPGDVYGQTKRCLEIGLAALAEAGAGPADVIRSRILLTDAEAWEETARAHGEICCDIRPASPFVEVSRFIDPAWLVETELDAVVKDTAP